MKKFLLSFAVAAFYAMSITAAPLTVNFSSNANLLPAADSSAEVSTATIEGVDFSFFHCKKGTYSGETYVQVSGKNYYDDNAAYIEFKAPVEVTKFTIHTGGNASTNVLVTLSCNGNDIPRYVKLKLETKNADFTFEIPEEYQAAGTAYRLTTANKYNAQITELVFNGDGVSTPVDPDPVVPDPANSVTVAKASEVSDGQFAFVFDEGYVSTFASNLGYGYWIATSATLADEMTVTKEAIFTLASTDKGYTITDCYNRIMGWDGQHWSFNAYETADGAGNCYWDVEMVDGRVRIVNKVKSSAGNEVYLAGKTYNSTYEMCPADREGQTIPYLYKVKTSGVAEIEEAEAGEAVYYNLQGLKVANPEKGLFIKVQGKKTSKVIL